MLKSWMRDIALAVQVRIGASPALFVWVVIIAVASLTAFVFLCVTAYDWLVLETSSIVAGLVMAGAFVLIAVIGIVVCVLIRRRARERAILERAARARAPSWLLDPKVLAAAVQVGRTLGWQRIVPIALLGVLAALWAREYREHSDDDGD
jgi:hypothetical protein